MELSDYIDCVAAEGENFATATEQGPLDAAVAACPGWDVRELVRHLGMIHLWAATNVKFPADDWPDIEDLPDLVDYWPALATSYPSDQHPADWYRRTLANLVDVLRSAPPDHQCFSFLPAPTPVTMWARRQASEIAIHRVDAERAHGIESSFAAPFAIDMLDELLSGFAVRPGTIDGLEHPKVLHIDPSDSDERWLVSLGPDRTETSRLNGREQHRTQADLTIEASASDLYVMLWNRTPTTEVAMDGDLTVLDLWRENFRVRWS